MRRTAGRRGSDTESVDDPADQDRPETGTRCHQQQPGDADRHADDDHLARMATVGVRSEEDLGDEAGEEADADDDADLAARDVVLALVVVDDREQHAVPGGQRAVEPPEREQDQPRRRAIRDRLRHGRLIVLAHAHRARLLEVSRG